MTRDDINKRLTIWESASHHRQNCSQSTERMKKRGYFYPPFSPDLSHLKFFEGKQIDIMENDFATDRCRKYSIEKSRNSYVFSSFLILLFSIPASTQIVTLMDLTDSLWVTKLELQFKYSSFSWELTYFYMQCVNIHDFDNILTNAP